MPSIPRAPQPPRVAIYARVSTADQELDGTSLDTQRERALAYCTERGYHIVQIVTEVHTGSELYERAELSKLRELVRSHQVDVLLSYALDRLSRNQAHVYVVADECERHGARLEFVTEDFEDSAVGRFVRSAKAFAAEVEREKITERAVRGMRARAQAGRMIPGWKPPYGYLWTDDRGGLRLDPQTAPVVERIFQEALEGRTLRSIALGLIADGIPTPTGQQAWAHATIRWILHHPVYTGQLHSFRQKTVRHHGRKSLVDRPEEEHIPLPDCPAIVSRETYALIARKLTLNQQQASRNNANPLDALLRGGYVRCGYCGRLMQVLTPSQQREASRYVCNKLAGAAGVVCEPRPSIAVAKLDRLVWARLTEFLSNAEVLPLEFSQAAELTLARPKLGGITRQLDELQRQQQRLVDNLAFVEGEAAILVSRRLREISEQQSQLRSQHHAQQDELEHWQEVQGRIEQIRDWCALTAHHLETMDFPERRAALEWLGVQVVVWKHSDQAPELSVELPDRATPPVTLTLVGKKAGLLTHNDGIRLRWRLE